MLSEQGKFRVRVDISHLACCFNNFSQADPDFQEMEMAEVPLWGATV